MSRGERLRIAPRDRAPALWALSAISQFRGSSSTFIGRPWLPPSGDGSADRICSLLPARLSLPLTPNAEGASLSHTLLDDSDTKGCQASNRHKEEVASIVTRGSVVHALSLLHSQR
ncbi:hypothetical protein AAFF_G00131750 [Aldrovandia affinis]|uniref:Uncharacterized protein n=1 Tax=Aldrovandia affinis TaxID=143900 RepID=A0AAD7RR26_9TELE|nr:hypothetical protein AAFF_G00131750 [Aldrovandia affinis]